MATHSTPDRHQDEGPLDDKASGFVLSVIVPAYNEAAALPELHKRLIAVLRSIPCTNEIIYVNDGSTDETYSVLMKIRESDPDVAVLDLSRNYGKEIAMTAGLDHSSGDAVVILDADLQHPPELIAEMIAYWKQGYDVIYAKRISRNDEHALKRITANAFYKLMRRLTRIDMPENSGDFRLLSRRAVESVCRLREQHRFMKGLFAWIGYRQKAVLYNPECRISGETKWSYWKLWNFAIEGITSFTTAPLKLATYIGFSIALAAFSYGLFIIANTLIYGNPVKGYPSLIAIILFLGGVQLIFIGIIGEYIGRVFDETKGRPLYLVASHQPSALQQKDGTAIPQ